ncbi:DUF1990 domain-containing protein [Microbacterium paludicola]|uniref:DUF1990 domain-containing protein n=1 Tax=Microbacterium paludicola TaxID=300019 RepID=A0A4Y9FXH1_9MICO|nr:DUF1990 domain-containing protein [Microbacterium paludicola]MBF0815422.1 DUF1990 domain-containing protein [Microbacterium paludicola]TFU33960.1 DUF1990 domain-containing protein [Microbacterium paludicola]
MTDPAAAVWAAPRGSGRVSERSAEIGRGDAVWARATGELLSWAVKTRSGFTIADTTPVAAAQRLVVVARVGWIRIREPIEVVQVVNKTDRVGFSYRTLPGHPVSGEEAFILHREGEAIRLTVRSLTRPAARGGWRLAWPALLLVQRIVRRRYLRALR